MKAKFNTLRLTQLNFFNKVEYFYIPLFLALFIIDAHLMEIITSLLRFCALCDRYF